MYHPLNSEPYRDDRFGSDQMALSKLDLLSVDHLIQVINQGFLDLIAEFPKHFEQLQGLYKSLIVLFRRIHEPMAFIDLCINTESTIKFMYEETHNNSALDPDRDWDDIEYPDLESPLFIDRLKGVITEVASVFEQYCTEEQNRAITAWKNALISDFEAITGSGEIDSNSKLKVNTADFIRVFIENLPQKASEDQNRVLDLVGTFREKFLTLSYLDYPTTIVKLEEDNPHDPRLNEERLKPSGSEGEALDYILRNINEGYWETMLKFPQYYQIIQQTYYYLFQVLEGLSKPIYLRSISRDLDNGVRHWHKVNIGSEIDADRNWNDPSERIADCQQSSYLERFTLFFDHVSTRFKRYFTDEINNTLKAWKIQIASNFTGISKGERNEHAQISPLTSQLLEQLIRYCQNLLNPEDRALPHLPLASESDERVNIIRRYINTDDSSKLEAYDHHTFIGHMLRVGSDTGLEALFCYRLCFELTLNPEQRYIPAELASLLNYKWSNFGSFRRFKNEHFNIYSFPRPIALQIAEDIRLKVDEVVFIRPNEITKLYRVDLGILNNCANTQQIMKASNRIKQDNSFYLLGQKLNETKSCPVYEGDQDSGCVTIIAKDSETVTLLQTHQEMLEKLEGHPAVPRILDAGRLVDSSGMDSDEYRQVHIDKRVLVIEMIEGKTLNELGISELENDIRMNEGVRVIKKVAEQLADFHSRGIKHGDVKPQNIMIRDSDESVVFIDWELATEEEMVPEILIGGREAVYGAPYYVPHKLLNEKGFNKQYPSQTRDIYGLTATLFHIVTGIGLNVQKLDTELERISHQGLRSFFKTGLDPDCKTHYKSVKEFLDALDVAFLP